MAANSRCQGIVFLCGHGLLVLGFVFFTAGFATDHWMRAQGGDNGLWRYCDYKGICKTTENLSSWLLATRAFQTLSLMCYMLAFLLALLFHCLELTASCHGYTGNPRVLEIFTFIGTAFCIIGVSLYGAKADELGTLDYSYSLTVFSLFLIVPGLLMVVLTRGNIHNNKAISPHPGEANSATDTTTSTVVVSHSHHDRQPGGTPVSGRQQNNPGFSYGQGQHRRPGGTDANITDGGDPPYMNNDRGRWGPQGSEPGPQLLPYPMHPAHAPLPMPELRPARREGEADYGQQGQGRIPARLPPLGPFAPSAPPDDDEAPPSYLEAIGHGYR